MGYLEGHANVGPLQPVEPVGVPTPVPSPAVCTARRLVVVDAQTSAEVARFDLVADCTCRVGLPPGTYRVELQHRGIDSIKDLPKRVTTSSGVNARLDISIDRLCAGVIPELDHRIVVRSAAALRDVHIGVKAPSHR